MAVESRMCGFQVQGNQSVVLGKSYVGALSNSQIPSPITL